MRTRAVRPRWTWLFMRSTACWSWDARATSASPEPGRGWGDCVHTPDRCTTLMQAFSEILGAPPGVEICAWTRRRRRSPGAGPVAGEDGIAGSVRPLLPGEGRDACEPTLPEGAAHPDSLGPWRRMAAIAPPPGARARDPGVVCRGE